MNEPVETGLVVAEPDPVSLGVLRADTPGALVTGATLVANALASVIESRKLYSNISGRRYVRCEGWTTLAAMLGTTPHEVSVEEPTEGTFVATVELRRLRDGAAVARASAECGMDEPTWAKRARYARRSMALTRATAKAGRLAFSWVMVLAGFEPTPQEEIPVEDAAPRLPGDAKKWNGHGGKPIKDVPTDVLNGARDWLVKKDATRNADLIRAVEEELEARRIAALDDESEDNKNLAGTAV